MSRGVHKQALKARGFTLLELIVVMALMSLVMLGLGASLRSFASTEARVDARLERAHDLRSTARFVQTVGARLHSERRPARLLLGASPYWWDAGPQSLQWVGIMPARFGAGGRYFFRLSSEPTDNGQALVLRFVPWAAQNDFPDWAQAESRVLVPNLQSLALRYLDARAPEPTWVESWASVDHLPTKWSLLIHDGRTEWPEIVVNIQDLEVARGVTSGFVQGGSRR